MLIAWSSYLFKFKTLRRGDGFKVLSKVFWSFLSYFNGHFVKPPCFIGLPIWCSFLSNETFFHELAIKFMSLKTFELHLFVIIKTRFMIVSHVNRWFLLLTNNECIFSSSFTVNISVHKGRQTVWFIGYTFIRVFIWWNINIYSFGNWPVSENRFIDLIFW